jgi:hypothetical protein
MMKTHLHSEVFIDQNDNNLYYHNSSLGRSCVVYLPRPTSCKRFAFFIAEPHEVEVKLNNPEAEFWGTEKTTLLIPGVPGTKVVITEQFGKWLVTSPTSHSLEFKD